jgi:signal transduction histidine kinase
MWRAPRAFPVVPAAIGVILLLLAVLATLQYRWAGELSEAEHERLRTSAKNRAEAFAKDFDAEITRIYRQLELDRATLSSGDLSGWVSRYEAWKRTAAWPGLVSGVYLLDPAAGFDTIARYDAAQRSFESGPWPDELAPLRQRLSSPGADRGPGGGPAAGPNRPGPMLEPILDEIPALAIMGFGRPRREPPGPRQMSPVVVAVLDPTVIRGLILPALAERHFGGPAGLDHSLRIVRQRARDQAVWSTGAAPDTPDRVDAAAGLFELRSDRSPDGPRGGPGFPSRGFGEDSGHWRLEAANKAGPLDAVVAAARRRNLAVSFGVLLLLAAAVLLVVISSTRAERLADRQVQFVAAVSHELRTPVAVIQSSAENLADGVVTDPAKVRKYGAVIRDEGRRLGEMLEGVLAFAGARSTERTRRNDPLAVATLIEESVQTVAAASSAHGFVVERQIPDGLPRVRGDAAQLRRALRNLLENAMKYDAGRAFVAVRAAASADGREVEIRVEDHGQGIDPADLPHVFEPFYRGRVAQERQVHGFGLGLSLVRRTVEDHGGRVAVESTPGQGTTFTLHLPAEGPAEASAASTIDGLPNPSV